MESVQQKLKEMEVFGSIYPREAETLDSLQKSYEEEILAAGNNYNKIETIRKAYSKRFTAVTTAALNGGYREVEILNDIYANLMNGFSIKLTPKVKELVELHMMDLIKRNIIIEVDYAGPCLICGEDVPGNTIALVTPTAPGEHIMLGLECCDETNSFGNVAKLALVRGDN